jgi:hypothetical protein
MLPTHQDEFPQAAAHLLGAQLQFGPHCIRSLSGTDLSTATNPTDCREDACPSLTFDRIELLELEFYLYSSEHPDPFVHRSHAQQRRAHWALHRVGSGFRGGSFKGIDLAFASPPQFGGILLRSIRIHSPGTAARLVCGPSLCVDALLALAGADSPAALAGLLEGLPACGAAEPSARSPLSLHWGTPSQTVFSSARVGLRLPREAQQRRSAMEYIDRPYRFLTEPRLPKGRAQLALQLLAAGHSHDTICKLMGARPRWLEQLARHASSCHSEGTVAGASAMSKG